MRTFVKDKALSLLVGYDVGKFKAGLLAHESMLVFQVILHIVC